ncbi:hypothetical protein CTAM01_01072 [Colletotrichum tamarilloi]|uniref:Uncharacterized protein n=1 Tax=Colletotrichum tamarilloi TaxID=1209934 RepID=A0ABQ9RT02_9PEZI|nr:uncharacterized protein CTAM01_01072 [Colletotrichum tamarilloi]KAI3549124.1 hypothetical protein CSPX01_02684 [Colletotrichum filicis]KAK1512142.1 hypothetical protein CTAM01_01072 [Colletotrichum tamarilloi]
MSKTELAPGARRRKETALTGPSKHDRHPLARSRLNDYVLVHGNSHERPPSFAYQNPDADVSRGSLTKYMNSRDNITEYMLECRRAFPPVSD